MSALKPLKYPNAWLALWAFAIVVVIVLCLLPAGDVPDAPNGWDKVEHASAYFLLAFSAVQLFARKRALAWVAFGLALLGGAIELAQGTQLIGRDCDVFDEVADCVGIAIGMAMRLTPWRDWLLAIERKFF